MCGNETEARIVSRVTNHHDSATAEVFATRETLKHERRADALALVIWQHSHGGKSQHVQVCVLHQGDSRKQNVPDHSSSDLRNERNTMTPFAAQGVDDISLGGCLERSLVHRTNSCAVSFGFWTNTHTSKTAYTAAVQRSHVGPSSVERWSAATACYASCDAIEVKVTERVERGM